MDSELWKNVQEEIDNSFYLDTAKENEKSVLDKQILDIYDKVAIILSRYKSGKLPKAFKVIPSLKNWEQILLLTRPEEWTPNACFQATKIFISALTPKLASKFLAIILLPKVRTDFSSNKKLNPHYYQAIKLSISRPSAFFSGFFIPICLDERLTQKEAAIMASVLKKMSIPVLYSAAALMKMCSFPFYGPRAILIRSLIEKKYSLPQSAISSVVDMIDKTSLLSENNTVLWQQLVLSFCQSYSPDLSQDQKQLVLMSANRLTHASISGEIIMSIEKTYSILS